MIVFAKDSTLQNREDYKDSLLDHFYTVLTTTSSEKYRCICNY